MDDDAPAPLCPSGAQATKHCGPSGGRGGLDKAYPPHSNKTCAEGTLCALGRALSHTVLTHRTQEHFVPPQAFQKYPRATHKSFQPSGRPFVCAMRGRTSFEGQGHAHTSPRFMTLLPMPLSLSG